MPYQLKVYNNAYYMDEEEARIRGSFTTYQQALASAKEIVQRFMQEQYKWGMEPAALMSQYTLYGDDPVIVSDEEPLPEDHFSAWTYARELAESYCGKKSS